jgi:hypothetical protein
MLPSMTRKGLIAIAAVALAGGLTLPTIANASGTRVNTHRGMVSVNARGTRVHADRSGRVRVKAPYTRVSVDPDYGRVRVRAPYVNLTVRW